MTKAIELGIPQSKIEEAAALRQARIDNGQDVIVGVNQYCAVDPSLVDIREIEASHVRGQQAERLASVRASRDEGAVVQALAALREAASSGEGNLLDLSIKAMAVRSTVGEVSSALADVFQRHQAGAYSLKFVPSVETPDRHVPGIREKIARFVERKERAPRILLTKLGQDGHDRGMKVLAGMFKNWGFDVDIAALFSDATEIARWAASKEVDVIGVSSHAGGHKALVTALNAALKAEGARDIMLICGGIIPPTDGPALEALGVQAVYGPGTSVSEIAADVLVFLERRGTHCGQNRADALVSVV